MTRTRLAVASTALSAALLCAVAAAVPVVAADGTSSGSSANAPEGTRLTVCDSLVTLRRVMMPMPVGGDSDEPAPAPDRTGCSEVPAGSVGAVERRTIVGGAPYECRSIDGGPCRWVQP